VTKLERLTAIILLLQEGARTSGDIARSFEVSRRTVLRDIQALSEMGVPVIAREGVGGGYSLPGNYHVPPLPITSREAFLLLLALSTVRGLTSAPYAAERSSLLAKLRTILPQQDLLAGERMLQTVRIDIPQRPQRAPYLEPLMAAAQGGHWVRVEYKSADKISTQNILPRQVSNQNGLWYCRAYSHERKEERVFRVDRIRAFSPSPGRYKTPPSSVPYDHPGHPEIRASFTPRGAAMAEVDPHIANRIERGADGSGDICLRCPPSELAWYARFFARFGEEVIVHGPLELRQNLRQLGRDLAERYS
jgi:predicted DNA-binding transcriptional regulator YafY